jgi:hypothetical protein
MKLIGTVAPEQDVGSASAKDHVGVRSPSQFVGPAATANCVSACDP